MTRITTVTVECKCGQRVFKYQKAGTGRLIKCFLGRILEDYISLPKHLPTGASVLCSKCSERIGTIQLIHGAPAVKLNQGQIQPVRIG